MARRSRLDAELVRRGLARSREHAVALIAEGRVAVSGRAATKPATGVEAGTPVVVRTDPDQPSWVSRGAHKLLGALDAFAVAVEGRRALDAGASTGGFTEVLLSRGAAEVVAVDVGYGELAWSLRTDERVRVHERTNVRTLDARGDRRPGRPRGRRPVVHLAAAGPARARRLRPRRRRPAAHGQAAVRGGPRAPGRRGRGARPRAPRPGRAGGRAAPPRRSGWGTAGVVASPLPGPAGNVEFFLWLRRDAGPPGRRTSVEQCRGPQ